MGTPEDKIINEQELTPRQRGGNTLKKRFQTEPTLRQKWSAATSTRYEDPQKVTTARQIQKARMKDQSLRDKTSKSVSKAIRDDHEEIAERQRRQRDRMADPELKAQMIATLKHSIATDPAVIKKRREASAALSRQLTTDPDAQGRIKHASQLGVLSRRLQPGTPVYNSDTPTIKGKIRGRERRKDDKGKPQTYIRIDFPQSKTSDIPLANFSSVYGIGNPPEKIVEPPPPKLSKKQLKQMRKRNTL